MEGICMTMSTTATATMALEAFASGLHPERSRLPTADGPPLFMAARAVGTALGETVRPAAPSENPAILREPLEAIARASHLRLRRVRLSDGWWRQDCGPLLAYTREDHRPVALLPTAATRYVLFDPLYRTRTPVQTRLAATLTPQAYTFYRPFPQRALHWLDLLTFGL